jgi:hypothetical protein
METFLDFVKSHARYWLLSRKISIYYWLSVAETHSHEKQHLTCKATNCLQTHRTVKENVVGVRLDCDISTDAG